MSEVRFASTQEMAQVRERLAVEVATDGHRLGLMVAHTDEVGALQASEMLESVDLLPLRRLARVCPRLGEDRLRAADLVDFVQRYGHEYVAALFPPAVFSSSNERSHFEAVCAQEGCVVLWLSPNQTSVTRWELTT